MDWHTERLLTKLVAKLGALPWQPNTQGVKVSRAEVIILENPDLSICEQAKLAGLSVSKIRYARWCLRREGKLGKYDTRGNLIADVRS